MIRPERSSSSEIPTLCLEPIGYVRSALGSKVEAARQPGAARGTPGRIELLPGRHFEHALEDLAGWDLIWVLFWFHLNPSWRPKVLPPRSATGRKGVFSTRSPHRPNPLGLSAVRLERIEGLTLYLRDIDMVDGTPVLDLKPYVPYTDAHPGAGSGWLEAGAVDPVPAFHVEFEPLASEQVDWVETRTGLALRKRIRATLALGPAPHPYRRIRREGNALRLAVKEWRVRFEVRGGHVRVLEVRSGFRPSQILAGAAEEPTRSHAEFIARWPPAGQGLT
jgi:tRNA-Thr(GGU) m(6)t(6)A37 methyltransferase TsaA